VLLDYVMPKIDGGTVAKEMKRHKPLVPIIMVSGNHVESASSCADFFIAKGKEPALLLERIARFLGT
jgi:DNA-binding response OmpR family regulator